jgi:hypothetical protein
MAQIDPSIAMGYRPVQIESPINQMAAIAQLRGAQEASQLNALKLQEYEQQQREQNELAKIMGDSTLEFGSEPFMRAVLTKAPRLFEGVAARAAQRENVIAQREARETQTKEREQKLSKEQLQSSLAELASYSTVDDARSALEQKVVAGALTREQADKYGMGLPANDADMPAWQLRTMRSLLSPKELLADIRTATDRTAPKPEKMDLNGKIVTVDMNPNSDTYKQVIREDVKTAAPRQEQLLTPEEERQKIRIAAAGRTPPASDNPNKVAHTSTDDQGNVTFYNAFGQVIRTQTNAGKRSPTLIKQEQAEQNLSRDIDRTTKELTEITKDGGLIDQSTGSGAGRLADISARFVGRATEGDIAITKLKPIADMVLKMVPRFEGPQSDKDTQSYKEAAGQLSDPSLPTTLRKEAGKTILRLMKERKDQFAGEGMDTSPNQRRAAPPPPSGFVPDKN